MVDFVDGNEANKVDQEVANYRAGSDEASCAQCVNFVPPNKCRVVKGIIQAGGVSDLFQPKTPASNPEEIASTVFGGGAV